MAPPSVLIAYASRHHGTEGIAETIAGALRGAGFRVDLKRAAAVTSVARYAAVILGSAVYMAQWDESALGLLRRERAALAGRPVWLFSSGPVGESRNARHPERVPQPEAVAEVAAEIGARGVAMFGGRVDPTEPGFEITVMEQAGVIGDWRDLPRVRLWAHGIGRVLREEIQEPPAQARDAAALVDAAT